MRDFNALTWLRFKEIPGLDTETDPDDLTVDHTPAAKNLNINLEGRLTTGAAPAGTTRIVKTVGLDDGNDYSWLYQRAWRISGNILIYGAPYYDSVYLEQGVSKLAFDEDSNAVVAFIPFGQDKMAIGKASGSYIIGNMLDASAQFTRTSLMQDITIADATYATELSDVAYFSTPNGIYSFSGDRVVKEITRRVRFTAGNFSSVALTCDYAKKRIIGTGADKSVVYDVMRDKLYDFSGADFLYTTPNFHAPDFSPVLVDRVVFAIDKLTADTGQITFQVSIDDQNYGDPYVATTDPAKNDQSAILRVQITGRDRLQCRRFRMKITGVSASVGIMSIALDVSGDNLDSYST